MNVTLNDDQPATRIASTGQLVEPGETVEVDDDLGRSLIEQGDKWAKAPKTAEGTKTAKKED